MKTTQRQKSLFTTTAIAAFAATLLASSASAETLMLKDPTISSKHMAFTYGGDIWVADRKGNNPRRLTSRAEVEAMPHFSPDGKTIAFSAQYDGNVDVYTIPVEGGQPTRLTWHPDKDLAKGWYPDGKEILFTSRREMTSGRSSQAWHVSTAGGLPTKVMDAVIQAGGWNNTGDTLAYQPYREAHGGASGWRNHRGGATPPIWILNPASGSLEKVPHERASDLTPFWLKGDVYFISDRTGVRNIWRYDSKRKSVNQVSKEDEWDIQSASTDGKSIIYATTAGAIKEISVRGKTKTISLTVNTDSPEARLQWKDAMQSLSSLQLSPTGKRALISARGEIFTVPLKDGSTRNLTNTSGVKEGGALWSPKGDKIAYLSDATRTWQIIITDQKGAIERTVLLADADYALDAWSPDGKKILYSDNHLNVYFLNVTSGKSSPVYTDNARDGISVSFSPDSKWIAYTKTGANQFGNIYLHNIENGNDTRITDGMSHAASPAFSPDGKYLYFAASTNSGPTQIGLDLSTQERPLRFGLYALVLAADGKSPLLPKAGDEGIDEDEAEDASDEKSGKKAEGKSEGNKDSDAENKDSADGKKDKPTVIDLGGLTDRIVALPIAERNYTSLSVASDGALFFLQLQQPGGSIEPKQGPRAGTLMRFDFKSAKASNAMDRVQAFRLSADGKTLAVTTPGNQIRTGTAGKSVDTKSLDTSGVKAFINPREEWAQIFDEVWRLEKQYFYADTMHGLDWDAIYKKYQPLVGHIATRRELNQLLVEMIGEMQVGHNRVGGGDVPEEPTVSIGLLGADLRVEDGQYRIKRIYSGEKWNPFLKAPLAIPGIGATEGDYIHAVNGTDLSGDDNIYARFVGTVGNQVTLSVSKDGNADNAKDVVVEPIRSDRELRHWAWVEGNRQHVDEISGGKVGYVYLPNTAGAGFTYFNRMFFAQTDKKALVIDERQNGGGQAANYITDVLSRQYLAGWKDRDGMLFHTPGGAVYGPKVMLIDQDAGSGGDFLPYAFKHMGLGKLIGKTTWGGLIGIAANPGLIDGGFLTVPFFRTFNTKGEWFIENEGVAPDINVDLDPAKVNEGIDMQLDRAVAEVLNELKTYTPIQASEAPALPTKLGK